jgi:hypothetical protein
MDSALSLFADVMGTWICIIHQTRAIKSIKKSYKSDKVMDPRHPEIQKNYIYLIIVPVFLFLKLVFKRINYQTCLKWCVLKTKIENCFLWGHILKLV